MDNFRLLTIVVVLALTLPGAARASAGDEEYQAGQAAVADYRCAEALAHFEKAAEKGNVEARRIVRMMLAYGAHIHGPELRQDREQMRRWLRTAEENGDETAGVILSRLEQR